MNGDGEKGDKKNGGLVSSDEFKARAKLREKRINIEKQERARAEDRQRDNRVLERNTQLMLSKAAVETKARAETEVFLKTNERKIKAEIDDARDQVYKRAIIRQLGDSAANTKAGERSPVLISFFGDADTSAEGAVKRQVLKNWVGNKYADVDGDEWPMVCDANPDYDLFIEWQPKGKRGS
ncbi:hypothetical protein HY969_04345 [Candidatus Kaiserbacteria bacterium]|nr:hypothetical protein [Candidatus Kaiserbacteria bacterium]